MNEMILQQSPDTAALIEGRERLAEARAALAEREAGMAQVRAQLKAFEGRYLRQVGVLYADLDEIEARIAEREVDLYDSEAARRRAKEARERATETHEAAFSGAHEAPEFDPPVSLKTLFREVAKRIHPDFARDEDERRHLTLLMAKANEAYTRGDTETLERMLDDSREISAAVAGEGAASELERMARQVGHAERDIAALGAEEERLRGSEIGLLYGDAEIATGEGRDLLAELAAGLREQIAEAQYRFNFLERQMHAHGR